MVTLPMRVESVILQYIQDLDRLAYVLTVADFKERATSYLSKNRCTSSLSLYSWKCWFLKWSARWVQVVLVAVFFK